MRNLNSICTLGKHIRSELQRFYCCRIRLRRTAPSHTNQVGICGSGLASLFRFSWSCRLNGCLSLCLSRRCRLRLGRNFGLSFCSFLCLLSFRSSCSFLRLCSLFTTFSLCGGFLCCFCAFLRRCGCFLGSGFLSSRCLFFRSSCSFLLGFFSFRFLGLSLGFLFCFFLSFSLGNFLCFNLFCIFLHSYHRYLMTGNGGKGYCGIILRFFLISFCLRLFSLLNSLCFLFLCLCGFCFSLRSLFFCFFGGFCFLNLCTLRRFGCFFCLGRFFCCIRSLCLFRNGGLLRSCRLGWGQRFGWGFLRLTFRSTCFRHSRQCFFRL